MKKSIHSILLFTIILLLSPAKADLLYFMTEAYDPTGWKYFDFAMVGVAKNGEVKWNSGEKVYLNIQGTPDSGVASSQYLATDSSRYSVTGWADISDYTDTDAGYTFYVETYENDEDDPLWGYSDDGQNVATYEELLEGNHIYIPGEMSPQDVTVWVAVPEPSSGLLLLLGLASLALRRRMRD